ncbi:MAG: GPW/gp25 family protein [Raineya sp.]|jgi:hypothetical protein|nr:GPW/gp25 family protein [Raineya sp.]
MQNHKKTFLGVGWKFPPSFDKQDRSVRMVSEEKDIEESLRILLSTKPGERVLNLAYGCDMRRFLFEPIDTTTVTLMKSTIEQAINNYEPRIELNDVNIEPDDEEPTLIYIDITYTVQLTNTRTNMVFPYYLLEGTEILDK